MPYDFIAYQGSTTEIEPILMEKYGFRAAVVLEVIKRIPRENIGHKLFMDNFFTTYPLLEVLHS